MYIFKIYNQNGIKPITYFDDIDLSLEFFQEIKIIKLSRSNNSDLYSIKWVFIDTLLLICEKYDDKNIGNDDSNKKEQIKVQQLEQFYQIPIKKLIKNHNSKITLDFITIYIISIL